MAEIPGLTSNTDTSRTPGEIPAEFQDQTEANAKIAAQVAAQDTLANPGGKIEDITHTHDALDKLLTQKQADEKPEIVPGTEAAKSPAQSPAKSDEQPDPNAVAEAEKAAKAISEADAKKVEDEKLADDIFKDAPALPTGASAKSHEAFAFLKVKAAQDISAARKEAEELKKRVTELEAKSQNPIPEDIKKRLDEADLFRARLDVEADPRFKANVKKISAAQDFIYAQLKKSRVVTDGLIEKIKGLGGPENVDMTKLFSEINDPVIQRLVDSKIAEIETVKYDQDKAKETAKANVAEYLRERQEMFVQGATAHNQQTKTYLDELNKSRAWAQEKTVPANATAEEAAAIKAHNDFVAGTTKEVQGALNDDSPQMRAILLMGMGELFHTQAQLKGVQAQIAAKDATIGERDKVIAEHVATIARLKNAGASRIRDGGAPQAGAPKPATIPSATDHGMSTRDALDIHAREVMEKRAAAGRS